MNDLNIKSTIVFQQNYEALQSDKRFIINQGGSRSSKTISLCQLMIVYALTNPNKTISIIRKTFPTLRATVMRDFFEIMNELDIYDRSSHNKTENIYTFPNGSMIEFFSTDMETKLRGRSRDIAWINEATELLSDEFTQINLRTREKILADYNPSDATSWLYDLPVDETLMIKSTYKHNPFLQEAIIKQIENLQHTDEALWSIYGMGERSMSRKNIFGGWQFVPTKPDDMKEYVMGCDFGFNHYSSLVKVWYNETQLYIESVIYERYLTTSDLIKLMDTLGIDKNVEIMADHSRPEIIQEMKEAGYYVVNANKAVKKGIDLVKSFQVYAKDDPNIIKEYENYMWRKVGDLIIDEPVKMFDDIMDSVRYATFEIKQNKLAGGMSALFFD